MSEIDLWWTSEIEAWWPLAETYWGKPGRPVHILVRNKNDYDWDSLCGHKRIDVGGTPCHYAPERVPEVATCRRCLQLWEQRQAAGVVLRNQLRSPQLADDRQGRDTVTDTSCCQDVSVTVA